MAPSLVFVDDAGVQISVNCHLLTWHTVECKSRRDFTDSRRTFGDHHKLNHHDDDKDDQPSNDVAIAGNKVGKGCNDATGGLVTLISCACQNQPRGRDIEHQSGQRRSEQYRGKDAEFKRRTHVDGRQQHDNRDRNVAS